MKKSQRGGTILGIILGIIVGLGAALAVAVYVTKVPVPFMNKGAMRPTDQDDAEAEKNKNWDPNSPLYGKNPARIVAPAMPEASGVVSAPVVVASMPRTGASKPVDSKIDPKADPLGDLVKSKAAAASNTNANANANADPFDYFVQAGAFRTQADADTQRAKLTMMGLEAKISEREQNGRTVFRVRIGPFGKRDDAGKLKEKLDDASVESSLVRVQR